MSMRSPGKSNGRGRRLAASAAALATLSVLLGPGGARGMNDDEIRGYAAAVLQREFHLETDAVSVEGGVVRIDSDLPDSDREKVREILEQIDGVQAVEFRSAETREAGFVWLPLHLQFKPLLADPRWPHFAAAYRYYFKDSGLTNVASADLGESFSLVRYNLEAGGSLELGLQAGVFAIFDLGGTSFDLINADYLVAAPMSYAVGNWTAMLRILHQSSHLGDEFVLNNQITRINFSYEEIDALVSYELGSDLRLYGGAGYAFRVEPSSYRPWSLQGGTEWSTRAFDLPLGAAPVVALDLQSYEEGGWATNVSLRAGAQFGKPLGTGRNLQVLLEFFNGRSPDGQFYDERIGYLGLGLHLYF